MHEQDGERGSGPRSGPAAEDRVPGPVDSSEDARVVLSSDRRREMLDILERSRDPLTIGQLAERLARRRSREPSTAGRQRLYLRLSQTHVPVLEQYGLVEYSDTVGAVSLAVEDDAVRDMLEWEQGGTTWESNPDLDTTTDQ